MAESDEERRRRLKADRQRRWRVRRKLGEQLGESAALMLPEPAEDAAGDCRPWPSPGNGLPVHLGADMFGALLTIGGETISEAIRYTRYVEQLAPGEALKPLRPGASPPASEARLQRQAAMQFLAHAAATPVSAIRVLKNAGDALDLAAEAQAITERRSARFPGAYRDESGQFVIPGEVEDDDAGPGL